MRGVKRPPLRLYWVETPDHHEDWFVVARSAQEAQAFFEESEGYDDGGAVAQEVLRLPEELQPAPSTAQQSPFPSWPTEQVIKGCGGVFMSTEPRSVQLAGRLYTEGLLEHEIQKRQRPPASTGGPNFEA